jgi:tripartite-type tricarboxylate transporter receptor subunit TctC
MACAAQVCLPRLIHRAYPVHRAIPTGGGTDIYARIIRAKTLRSAAPAGRSGQSLSARARVGRRTCRQSTGDGYTIWIGQTSNLTIGPHENKNSYDPLKDFAPIGLLSKAPRYGGQRRLAFNIAQGSCGNGKEQSRGKLTYATAVSVVPPPQRRTF